MASFTLPDTALDWTALIGAVCVGSATLWGGAKYAPRWLDEWAKRREEKRELTRGLIDVVAKFPPFVTKIEGILERITESLGETSSRVLKIEHTQLRQALMMHRFVERMSEAIVWTDDHGEPVYVTRGFTTMSGMTHATMREDGWKLMVHPDDLQGVEDAWQESRENWRMFKRRYRITNVTKPGEGYFEVDCVAIAMQDKSGWEATFTMPANTIINAPVSVHTVQPPANPHAGLR